MLSTKGSSRASLIFVSLLLLFLFPVPLITVTHLHRYIPQRLSSLAISVSTPYQQDLSIKIYGFLRSFNDSFYNLLLRRKGYDAITLELAQAALSAPDVPSCSYILTNTSIEENFNKLMEFLYIYKNFAEGIRKEYSISLPYIGNSEIRRLKNYVSTNDIIPACSIIDDYKELRKDAGEIVRGNENAVPHFYKKLFTISLKIIFMQESIEYKVSYKTVGKVFIKSGLYGTIYKYGGKTALKVAMSITHWAIRDYISRFIDEFPEKIDELINHIDNSDYSWVINEVKGIIPN